MTDSKCFNMRESKTATMFLLLGVCPSFDNGVWRKRLE